MIAFTHTYTQIHTHRYWYIQVYLMFFTHWQEFSNYTIYSLHDLMYISHWRTINIILQLGCYMNGIKSETRGSDFSYKITRLSVCVCVHTYAHECKLVRVDVSAQVEAYNLKYCKQTLTVMKQLKSGPPEDRSISFSFKSNLSCKWTCKTENTPPKGKNTPASTCSFRRNR